MDAVFNIQLYQLLAEWNPMEFEDLTAGDQEIYDCMDIIHQKYDHHTTVEKIQHVYRFAFDVELPADAVETVLSRIDSLQQTCKL